jgi:hypothetical protein
VPILSPAAGSALAAPAAAGCAPAGYSNTGVQCIVVPAHGSFSMKIAGTRASLRGTGSAATARTQITVLKVPAPVRSKGGFGLRLRATGTFNPLTVSPGKTYAYNASKNKLSAIKSIKAAGLYQVIL